jgi:hypothetical protein
VSLVRFRVVRLKSCDAYTFWPFFLFFLFFFVRLIFLLPKRDVKNRPETSLSWALTIDVRSQQDVRRSEGALGNWLRERVCRLTAEALGWDRAPRERPAVIYPDRNPSRTTAGTSSDRLVLLRQSRAPNLLRFCC